MNISRQHDESPSAYRSFSDIPADLRLETYESRFENSSPLDEYISSRLNFDDWSDYHVNEIKRAIESWRKICDEMDCHPALASPDVVEAWCEHLLETRTILTTYSSYVVHINKFFRYLMWHVDYPHAYNPVQFAVRESNTVNEVWYHHSKEDSDD